MTCGGVNHELQTARSGDQRPHLEGNREMETAIFQPLLDRRLDLIDQALLGLLPRQERQEIIAQVEARVKSLQIAGTPMDAELPLPNRAGETVTSASKGVTGHSKLSTLALLGGILGIGALVLLFAMPLTYIAAAFLGEAFGETGVIAALGSHVLLIAIGGLVAVTLGFTSLIRVSRNSEKLRGRGWAITALCTGSMPMFLGGMLALMTSVSVFATANVATVTNAPPAQTSSIVGPALPLPQNCSDNVCRPVEWQAVPMVAPANPSSHALPTIMPVGPTPDPGPSLSSENTIPAPTSPAVLPGIVPASLPNPAVVPAAAKAVDIVPTETLKTRPAQVAPVETVEGSVGATVAE